MGEQKINSGKTNENVYRFQNGWPIPENHINDIPPKSRETPIKTTDYHKDKGNNVKSFHCVFTDKLVTPLLNTRFETMGDDYCESCGL